MICKKKKYDKDMDLVNKMNEQELKDLNSTLNNNKRDNDIFLINPHGILYVQPMPFDGPEPAETFDIPRRPLTTIDHGIPVANVNNLDPNKYNMYNSESPNPQDQELRRANN